MPMHPHAHMSARTSTGGAISPAPLALPPLSGSALPPSHQPLSHMVGMGPGCSATANMAHPVARRPSHGMCAAAANNSNSSALDGAAPASPVARRCSESGLGCMPEFGPSCGALETIAEFGPLGLDEGAAVPTGSSDDHPSTACISECSGVLARWETLVRCGARTTLPADAVETLEGVKASVETAANDAAAATAALTAVERVLAARRADAERAHSAALSAARRMADMMSQLAASHQLPGSPETPASNNTAGRTTPLPGAQAAAAAMACEPAACLKQEPLANNLGLAELGGGELGCMGMGMSMGGDFMSLGDDLDLGLGMSMCLDPMSGML